MGAGRDPLEVFADPDAVPVVPAARFPELAFTPFSEGLPTSGTWLGYPLLFDFNQDGFADLIASNREEDGFNAWMAAKDGQWSLRIEGLGRNMGYGPAQAADVNSDGIPDLIASAHTDAMRIYINDGQMNWSVSPVPVENTVLMLDVEVGKLNADPFPDVVGVGHFKGGLSVYTGDGAGGLHRHVEGRTMLHDRVFGKDVELADLDGDGRDDVFATTNEGMKVFLTRGDLTFHWEDISYNLPNPKIGNTLESAVIGRFTGSARPELAVCMVADPGDPPGQRNTIAVHTWREAEKRWDTIDSGLDRDESYRDCEAGDFNGDGKLDLVVMSVESGGVIYLGDGTGGFRAKGTLPGKRTRGKIAVGDINGDGRLDIVITSSASKNNPKGGGVFAFLNRSEIWN